MMNNLKYRATLAIFILLVFVSSLTTTVLAQNDGESAEGGPEGLALLLFLLGLGGVGIVGAVMYIREQHQNRNSEENS